MKKYDFLTKEVKAELSEAMKDYTSCDLFLSEYGWADWMDDYTDAEDGEEASEAEIRRIDDLIMEYWKETHGYYYWLDTEYLFGDYSVKKWALMRGEFTEDGEKDRDTEEVLTWGNIPDTDDMDEAWNQIDEAIEAKLGFVPDYEVN